MGSLEGANPPALTQLVQKHFGGSSAASLVNGGAAAPTGLSVTSDKRAGTAGDGDGGEKLAASVGGRIGALLAGNDVMVFMKGRRAGAKGCWMAGRCRSLLRVAQFVSTAVRWKELLS